MMTRITRIVLAFMATLSAAIAAAQPPVNRHLAASTWPIYHANTYATAAVDKPIADPALAQTVDNLTHRRFGKGQVSPWTVLRAPTPEGQQVVLTTPLNGIGKYIIKQDKLHPVDFLQLDRKWTDFDWGILVLADGSAVVTEKKNNRFAVVGDRDNNPQSPLKVLRYLPVDADRHGELTAHFTLAHDGTLIALTHKPALIAMNVRDGRVLASYDLPAAAGMAVHNSFPIDEQGRAYLVAQQAMLAVDWNGRAFNEAWRADYNMRGPGFEHVRENRRQAVEALAVARGEPGTGSGTTPSLLGKPDSGVVVVVDGHSPRNNLVAFWRGNIPADWQPLPDPAKPGRKLDRRVAGVFALPHSTPDGEGHSAENSPAVMGNAIVVAQWAGFKPDESPPKGVQRVDWDPVRRKFDLVWANADVHINGVPTIGRGPDNLRVFGMGREGDRYVYSVLNLQTGKRERRIDLGASDDVLDQGNNHVIAADGSIIYSARGKMVRLHSAGSKSTPAR